MNQKGSYISIKLDDNENITSKNKTNYIVDEILTKFSDKAFNKLLQLLSIDGEIPRVRMIYVNGEPVYFSDIIQVALDMQKNFPQESKEARRIKSLLEVRDFEHFKRYITHYDRDEVDTDMTLKAINILFDRAEYNKFLDFESNKEYFTHNLDDINQEDYIIFWANLFGRKEELGLSDSVELGDSYIDSIIPGLDFNIDEELNQIKEIYSEIYDRFNLAYYTKEDHYTQFGDYTYYGFDEPEDFYYDGYEKHFSINPTLHGEVYDGMPDNLSVEQKALFIYFRLCYLLNYDDDYLYRDVLRHTDYTFKFSRERVESIVAGSNVTCFDFCRLCRAFINELKEEDETIEGIYALERF